MLPLRVATRARFGLGFDVRVVVIFSSIDLFQGAEGKGLQRAKLKHSHDHLQ